MLVQQLTIRIGRVAATSGGHVDTSSKVVRRTFSGDDTTSLSAIHLSGSIRGAERCEPSLTLSYDKLHPVQSSLRTAPLRKQRGGYKLRRGPFSVLAPAPFPHPSNTTFELVHLEDSVALHTKPKHCPLLGRKMSSTCETCGGKGISGGACPTCGHPASS
jgi:hypothetical protein